MSQRTVRTPFNASAWARIETAAFFKPAPYERADQPDVLDRNLERPRDCVAPHGRDGEAAMIFTDDLGKAPRQSRPTHFGRSQDLS